MNFSGKFGSASTIWYPASGSRIYNGNLHSGEGCYWSASPSSYVAYSLYAYYRYYGDVYPSDNSTRAYGQSVRCLQVND
jgi:hypothetical protein